MKPHARGVLGRRKWDSNLGGQHGLAQAGMEYSVEAASIGPIGWRSSRLHNVSTTGGESGGLGWTAGNETERRNRL